MTAGARGVSIVIDAGGWNMTGATCSLIAAPGDWLQADVSPPANAIVLTPVTVQPWGLTAVYTTTGMDFLTGGPWTFWLKVVTDSLTEISPPAVRYVNANPLLAA
jgi:hypothetical protein